MGRGNTPRLPLVSTSQDPGAREEQLVLTSQDFLQESKEPSLDDATDRSSPESLDGPPKGLSHQRAPRASWNWHSFQLDERRPQGRASQRSQLAAAWGHEAALLTAQPGGTEEPERTRGLASRRASHSWADLPWGALPAQYRAPLLRPPPPFSVTPHVAESPVQRVPHCA